MQQTHSSKKNVKKGIAVCRQACHHRYGNSHAIWDHTVLPETRQSWHSRLYPSQSWYSISDPRGMQGWVDPSGWLEMVYPLNGYPSVKAALSLEDARPTGRSPL